MASELKTKPRGSDTLQGDSATVGIHAGSIVETDSVGARCALTVEVD